MSLVLRTVNAIRDGMSLVLRTVNAIRDGMSLVLGTVNATEDRIHAMWRRMILRWRTVKTIRRRIRVARAPNAASAGEINATEQGRVELGKATGSGSMGRIGFSFHNLAKRPRSHAEADVEPPIEGADRSKPRAQGDFRDVHADPEELRGAL